MKIEEFIKELKQLDLEINPKQLKLLEKYYNYLIMENQKYNLTTIIDREEVYLKHFYDSLTIVKIVNMEAPLKVCDIGSGAGFPGVVLKIIFPKINLTLIESSQKKAKFLQNLCDYLDLEAKIINERAEKVEIIEEFDLIVSRAVAATAIILEIAARMIQIGGKAVLYKTNISREMKNLGNNKVALKLIDHVSFQLPQEKGQRALLLFKKTQKTPKKYPRNYNLIKKRPLF